MEAIEFTGPNQLAQHLARYVTCASTIRAHCIRDYGQAPDLSRIREWQDMHRRAPVRRVEASREKDAMMPRLGSLPVERMKRVNPPRRPLMVAPVSPESSAKQPWPTWYQPPGSVFLAGDLIASVAQAFSITPEQLRGKGRDQRFVQARAVVVRIMRDRGWSFPRLGKVMGDRDHSTLIHSARNFDVYARQDAAVQEIYDAHRAAGWCKR